tara:strand:+ start:3967 stop:4167 length:201 start_codon:yes stop_codon:yes gene_type:complete
MKIRKGEKKMEDCLVQKREDKEELMSMRVNMLRIMKRLKNLGYTKEETVEFFNVERNNKIKSTFFD